MAGVITSAGMNYLIQKAFGGQGAVSTTSEGIPNDFEIGIDDTSPSESDTSCTGRVPHTYTVVDNCDSVTDWGVGGDAGAEVLNEDDELVGTGCLNLPISYNTGTSYWEKTQSGFDLSTGTCDFYVFFFIDDKTNMTDSASAVIITLGTGGAGDSNEYYFADEDIVENSWSVLRIPDPSSPDNTNGSGATLSNIDYTRITIKTDGSYTGNSIRMDAWHYATEANHKKNPESGYPVHNSDLNQVTWKVIYNTNNANGYNVKRVYFKNTTPMGFNSGTFSAIRKDTSKQLTITTLLKVQNET